MLIAGIILLVAGWIVQSWLFVQSAKDEGLRPFVCDEPYFVFVTLGIVLATGIGGATCVGIASHWYVGVGSFIGMVLLAFPGGILVQRFELGIRMRLVEKLNAREEHVRNWKRKY